MAFLIGGVVVLLLLGGLFLLTRMSRPAAPLAEKHLPFAAAEQAYAGQIRFSELQMSRAANFLNQEVTFVFGAVSNDGARIIREIEVTVEFHDQFHQVILRDTRNVLGSRAAPLGSAQRRDFQLSFEHIPDDWNRQLPSIRVSGLDLQ